MGPLHGIRVVELGGQGPVPYCAMTLADLGAEIVTIRRPGPPLPTNPYNPVVDRGRRFVAVDLKSPAGVSVARRIGEHSDVVLEGFRPGAVERLGLGPDDLHAVNPRLVYGRMTGWGQDGPLSQKAGHDINYIALTGALDGIGARGGPPTVPLNLIGDYAGGALYLALGVVSALLSARETGRGQVVDAAIVDGVAALMSVVDGLTALGRWQPGRGENLLDGGAPFYCVYACADGRYVAVGALEEPFYLALLEGLGLGGRDDLVTDRLDRSRWPALHAVFAEAFAAHPRDHWDEVFADLDACVTTVLSTREARRHPHLAMRGTYVDSDDAGTHAAPVPRFDHTPPSSAPPVRPWTSDVRSILADTGFTEAEVDQLVDAGTVSAATW